MTAAGAQQQEESQPRWLIRGVTVPDADGGSRVTDILIGGGSVTAIESGLNHSGARVLDADGLIALPGLVDLHTHLREPGREDAETVETGTAAAAQIGRASCRERV